MCTCVKEFIIDLNNTEPDGESLKTRPIKTAPVFSGCVQNDPHSCANAAGLTACHKTHTHPLTSPPQALCCGESSVDNDIIRPRPMSNITQKSGKAVWDNKSQHHSTTKQRYCHYCSTTTEHTNDRGAKTSLHPLQETNCHLSSETSSAFQLVSW